MVFQSRIKNVKTLKGNSCDSYDLENRHHIISRGKLILKVASP